MPGQTQNSCSSLKIKSYFKTKSLPVSCRTEVEVAGQVGETGVQVARDELTVGGGGGDGVVHTCTEEGQG